MNNILIRDYSVFKWLFFEPKAMRFSVNDFIKYMTLSKINRFLLIVCILPGSAVSSENDIVKSLSISNKIQLLIKEDENGKFYFNDRFDELYKSVDVTPQAFDIKSNRSEYYPRVLNKIDYRFLLLNSKNNQIFPMLELSYPLNLDSYNNDNSFVIETYKDDVTRYKFLMKYNYIKKLKKVILTDIIYVESTITSDSDEVDYYLVNLDVPDSIRYLDYYNSKKYTDFIINVLYKKVSSLDLNIKLIKSIK